MENDSLDGWLRWVINFIQGDILNFDRTGKHSLFQELSWFASDQLLNTSFDPFGKSVQFSQNQIAEWGKIAPDIQTALKQFIDQMTTTRAAYKLPQLISSMKVDSLWPPLSGNPHVCFLTHSIPKDSTPKNWALLNLSKLLQGLRMNVIGKCKACRRYFLNFSLRKKIYCSPRCASRDLARTRKERWSERDYRAYLNKQGKLAMRRYVDKRKAEGKFYRPRPMERGSKKIPVIF